MNWDGASSGLASKSRDKGRVNFRIVINFQNKPEDKHILYDTIIQMIESKCSPIPYKFLILLI